MESIVCNGIGKIYGKKQVLKDINLTLEKGKIYGLKHYCVFGDKRKIEKGLTQETIIIDKTVLTEADMHNLTSLIHEKMPQVKVHEKERKNN